jgi:hypothetical protein
VSTARQGYIYKLSNPALLATYTYTAESLQCCASSCFLYVLTSVGLETWTLRTSDTYLPKSGKKNFNSSATIVLVILIPFLDPGVTTKLRNPQTTETYGKTYSLFLYLYKKHYYISALTTYTNLLLLKIYELI